MKIAAVRNKEFRFHFAEDVECREAGHQSTAVCCSTPIFNWQKQPFYFLQLYAIKVKLVFSTVKKSLMSSNAFCSSNTFIHKASSHDRCMNV